jgi:serine/threonine protein kinase
VYEGRLKGAKQRKCAVKVLFAVEITPEQIRRTCLEASLLHSLQSHSPHVVGLYGVAVRPPSLCVVLELCNRGSLASLLYDRAAAAEHRLSRAGSLGSFLGLRQSNPLEPPDSPSQRLSESTPRFKHDLSWEQRLELALGASRGLEALEAVLPGHSHNDIKSMNYLVHCPEAGASAGGVAGFRFVVKLADIEFCTAGVTPEHLARAESPNWTAPEVLAGSAQVSPASDVFSLAVVLYEIAERRTPFEAASPAAVAESIKAGGRPQFVERRAQGQGGKVHRYEDDGILIARRACRAASRQHYEEVVAKSWAQRPEERPSAATIAAELGSLRMDYVAQLERLKAHTSPTPSSGRMSASSLGLHISANPTCTVQCM